MKNFKIAFVFFIAVLFSNCTERTHQQTNLSNRRSLIADSLVQFCDSTPRYFSDGGYDVFVHSFQIQTTQCGDKDLDRLLVLDHIDGEVRSIDPITRQERYYGVSDSITGEYTVTYAKTFSSTPNVQASIINPSDTQFLKIKSSTPTGFTVACRERTDVAGNLPTYSNASGLIVNVLVTAQ